jgi:hypothetical protein
MGQVIVKASDEWVRLDVKVDGKGRTKTMYNLTSKIRTEWPSRYQQPV